MRTVETKVFQYDELDDKAKAKARDWYRSCNEGDKWRDAVYEDAVAVAKILGIQIDTYPVQVRAGKSPVTIHETSIMFSGFRSQGDGACFTGSYYYAKGGCKAIRKYAPTDEWLHRIADNLQTVQKECRYRISCKVSHRGSYNHSGCTEFEFDGTKPGDSEAEATRWLRSLMDWIYKQLNDEYDYLNPDSTVEENIQCNEYEFTSTGERFS